jgi:general secretion pathway protein J
MSRPATNCGQRARAGQAGFTLLEILVALVVLGFLLVGLTQGVRFGLRAWDTESRLVNTRADLDGVERVLRTMIEETDPGEFNEPANFKGDARSMSFASRLPMVVAGLPVREADIALGVDARHRLVLRWVPHPHAERLVPAAPAAETVLLEGVDHIELSYQRWPEQGGGWVSVWAAPTLPLLVSLKIAFAKDDRRHWPTMVTAPMRARFEE